jgi:hypothetical protein
MDIGTTNKTEVLVEVFSRPRNYSNIESKIENKDPEMEWILNDIKLKNNSFQIFSLGSK